MKADLASIQTTAQRCKQEGIPLSETALRRFVKCGDIPAVWIGNKALVLWGNVLRFIERGNGPELIQSEQSGTIRQIPERL